MKTIEITIAANGQAKVETKGFAGSECLAASRFLEQALGKRSEQQLTADYYQSALQQQREHEGS
ncbi:MAG: DUF2997 domain-containing protein [Pirellulaceae bacterium]